MRQRAVLVALEGPSAVGKSTLASALARRLGGAPIAEAYDRLDRPPSLSFRTTRELLALERRLLREEGRRYRAAVALVAGGTTTVADTGFLGPVSYTAGLVASGLAPPTVLRALTERSAELARRGRLGLPDLTVYLQASPRLLASRARGDPVRHPASLRLRHLKVARFERGAFRSWLSEVAPGRLRTLNATASPDELAQKIARWSARVVPLRRRSDALGRALAAEAVRQRADDGATLAIFKKRVPSARLPRP